jgi:hypothetical protein
VRATWQERLSSLTDGEQSAVAAALERADGAVTTIRQRWHRRRTQLQVLHRRQQHRLRCGSLRDCCRAIEETANSEDDRRLAELESLIRN